MSSGTRVLVIGCGIAGPVLAIFLKRKGYDPIMFERLDGVHDAGLSLMLQPNGLKVLTLVPGLREALFSSSVGIPIERLGFFSLVTDPPSVLGTIEDISSHLMQRYGQGMFAVSRSKFHHFLVEWALKEGIEVKWGYQLEGVEEVKGVNGEDEVEAIFANGERERGSFVVGCDGLHSGTRIALFGKENPDYTGVVQTGGISPTPNILKEKPMMANIFHVKQHMITYQISPTHSVWAISNAEPEAKESWKAIDEKKQEEIKASELADWKLGAGELVKGSNKIIKYGLYDRPELASWHKGRVVLLGDAAHPTTPHLGQGANQAFEDVYHLVLQLQKNHTSSSDPPTTSQLTAAFTAYESVRRPRSSEIVHGARERGGIRVVATEEAAKERDEMMRERFTADHAPERLEEYENIGRYPYEAESELVLS